MTSRDTRHPMDTPSVMSPRTIIAIVTLGVLAFAVYMTYFAARSDAPAWAFVLIWGMALFAGVLIARSYLPSAEERLARELETAPNAVQAAATVLRARHDGIMETQDIRRTRLILTADLSVDGGANREVELAVRVEDALLANFASGQTIHVLYDPADPSRVAVDRTRSPVQVQ